MKNLTADINLDEEVAHLATFIGLKWTPIANAQELFTEIRDAALIAARGLFDPHELWQRARELEDARKTMLDEKLGMAQRAGIDLYDALCTLLNGVGMGARDLSEAGKALEGAWNFEARVRVLEVRLSSKYPDLAGSRPLGWAELEKGYVEYDGQEEYDPYPDRELFQGALVEGVRSADFAGRVALPYVMHEEKGRGRKAPVSLVGAVFAHFLGIAEFLNTHKLKLDLAAALPQLHVPVMLFERTVTTDNPVLKVAFELAGPSPTQAEFDECLANLAAFDALSDEEKAQRKAANSARILEFLATLKDSSPEENQKYEAEKQRRITLLRAALN